MTSVSTNVAALPTSAPAAPNFTALVDAALQEASGTVTGGGKDGGKDGGIPPFVQQYLSETQAAGAPSAQAGVDNEHPTLKSDGTQTAAGQAARGGAFVQGGLDLIGQQGQQGPSSKMPPQSDGWWNPGPPPSKVPTTLPSKAPTPPGKTPPTDGPPSKVPSTPPSKAPTPPGKVGPVEQTGPSAPIHYTVKKGDSLSEIAEGFEGVTWQQIYTANKDQIANPDLIYPGQVLTIPSNDLEVAPFKYTPLFEPGIRGGPKRSPQPAPSTPPGKGPGKTPDAGAPPKSEAPPKGEAPGKRDAPGKTEAPPKGEAPGKTPGKVPAPGKDAPTTKVPADVPAPSTDDTPPSQGDISGELPPAPPAPSGDGLPPALPAS